MSDDRKRQEASPLADGGGVRVLLTTAPPGEARGLAQTLVEERLAACVNLVPGLRSIFRWKDAIANEPETLLLIKTSNARIDDLATRLAERHPYEVPELLIFTPESGLAPYLAWLGGEVGES